MGKHEKECRILSIYHISIQITCIAHKDIRIKYCRFWEEMNLISAKIYVFKVDKKEERYTCFVIEYYNLVLKKYLYLSSPICVTPHIASGGEPTISQGAK